MYKPVHVNLFDIASQRRIVSEAVAMATPVNSKATTKIYSLLINCFVG